jgi:uncharacterized protein (DUF2141 family)
MPTNNPTQSPNYGAITGRVFYDGNGNGSWDSTESAFNYGVIVTLHEGSCGNPAIDSSSDNSFTFTNLPAGSYCVKAVADGYINTTPTEVNVTITPGGSIYIEFGFFYFG